MQLFLIIVGLFVVTGPVAGPASIYYGIKSLEQKKTLGDSTGFVRTWFLFVLGAALALVGLWAIASMVTG